MQLHKLAKDLNLSEDEILSQSIQSYLDRELKNASLEINKFKLKYRVISPKELEQKIGQEEIAEHPGWEDVIEWVNLQKRVEQIGKWMQKFSMSS